MSRRTRPAARSSTRLHSCAATSWRTSRTRSGRKSFEAPIAGACSAPTSTRPTQRNAAPQPIGLLGRTSELAKLERAAQRALAGSFALVLVEGDAGLGKTRLLDEFVASIVGARIGRASCSELEQHLPYVPLAA